MEMWTKGTIQRALFPEIDKDEEEDGDEDVEGDIEDEELEDVSTEDEQDMDENMQERKFEIKGKLCLLDFLV